MNKTVTLLTAAVAAPVLASCSTSSADEATAAGTSLASTSTSSAGSTAPSTGDAESMAARTGTPITITAGNTVITAALNDSQVSQDFIRTLPLTLPWFRNGSIEYVTELEAPMTETGPFYTDVQPGDLVYYNPRDSITSSTRRPARSRPSPRWARSPPTSASSPIFRTTSTWSSPWAEAPRR